MSVQIAVTPERGSFTQNVELDGTTYRIRIHFSARRRSWYMDLKTADDVNIISPRRLSPGFFPVPQNTPNAPPGVFYVTTLFDPYEQADLGTSFLLAYMTSEELSATVVESNDEVVVTS